MAPQAPAPGPAPAAPAYRPAATGFGPGAALDVARVTKDPLGAAKSFWGVSRAVAGLFATGRNLTPAEAAPAMERYAAARQQLDAAPFKHLLPFFGAALDRWAGARFNELRPQVEARVSERVWHPLVLEWPDGGTGHERLSELMMIDRAVATATEAQAVRAFQGANRLQIRNSGPLDYFHPLARAGDALVLRRPLPLAPGQKPMAETLLAHMNQGVQVHVQIE